MRGRDGPSHGHRAHLRIAARHEAVHRRAVGVDRVAGPRGGCRSRRARRAIDDGRGADVRGGGRPRRARVEHRGAGPDQAAARRGSAVAAQGALRRQRLRPLRSGQAVSRRAAPALGARLLLARRRRARVAGSIAVRRRAGARRTHRGGRRAFHPGARGTPGCERRARAGRVRRRLVLPVARTPAAGQRRSVRFTPERRARARAAAACIRSRARYGRRLRDAAQARCRRRLAHGPVVPARRAVVSDARRLADGLPVAARLAAVGGRGRLPVRARGRSDRAAPAAAVACGPAPAISASGS